MFPNTFNCKEFVFSLSGGDAILRSPIHCAKCAYVCIHIDQIKRERVEEETEWNDSPVSALSYLLQLLENVNAP